MSKNGRQAMLIYHPLAGVLDVQPTIESIVQFWTDLGWNVNVQPSLRAGHARDLASQAVAEDLDMVLVAGGDGTLGEVASALRASKVILALLPSGTGNSFSKELSLPLRSLIGKRDLIRACESLAAGKIYSMDVGLCNDVNSWLLWTGVGLDGYIISRIEPRSRRLRRMGRFGYYALGLRALPKYQGMTATITVDGILHHGNFVLVIISNCRRYGAGQFVLHKEAVLDDGLFEISMFEGNNNRDAMRFIVDILRGRVEDHPRIKVIRGSKIEIVSNSPTPVHHDGDPAGSTPIKCRVDPRSLRLLVPESAPPNLFSGLPEPFRP